MLNIIFKKDLQKYLFFYLSVVNILTIIEVEIQKKKNDKIMSRISTKIVNKTVIKHV